MPPVENVAFLELVSSGENDMAAHSLRVDMDEREHVLQLITKADCPPA